MAEAQRTAPPDAITDANDTHSQHSARASSMRSGQTGRSAYSKGSSKSWKQTPSTFSEIERYAQHGTTGQTTGEGETPEVPEETFVERLQKNRITLAVIFVLLSITMVASFVPELSIWVAFLQVFAIFLSTIRWEEDQVLAKDNKYRGCRPMCQFFIVVLMAVLTGVMFYAGIFVATYVDDINKD
jgi:uncharacterized membrane protein